MILRRIRHISIVMLLDLLVYKIQSYNTSPCNTLTPAPLNILAWSLIRLSLLLLIHRQKYWEMFLPVSLCTLPVFFRWLSVFVLFVSGVPLFYSNIMLRNVREFRLIASLLKSFILALHILLSLTDVVYCPRAQKHWLACYIELAMQNASNKQTDMLSNDRWGRSRFLKDFYLMIYNNFLFLISRKTALEVRIEACCWQCKALVHGWSPLCLLC